MALQAPGEGGQLSSEASRDIEIKQRCGGWILRRG